MPVKFDPTILGYLTPEERKELDALLLGDKTIWRPDPENLPQCQAYESTADIIGFGGAAGGGKTDLGCGLTVNKHRRVGVFRDNGTELTAIIDRFAELFNGRDGFNGKDNIWRTRRSDGADLQIDFGSFPNPRDETKYQGRPHDLIILEEAANMRRTAALFVMGWLRTTFPKQCCQVLLTFNPPTTAEGRWIVDYFAPWLDKKYPNPAAAGELRWATSLPSSLDSPNGKELWVDGPLPFVLVNGEQVYDFEASDYTPEEIIRPQSRTFIPSRVSNNSYLKDTGYMATLQSLPEPLRSQMLNGDFSAGMEDSPWQVIPTGWVEAAMERWVEKPAPGKMLSLGADIAMGGKDNTVLARRYEDMYFSKPVVYPGRLCTDGPTVAGFIVAATRDGAPQHIDLLGVGAQPYGHLMEMHQDAIGIDMGGPTNEMDKGSTMAIYNIRSLLYWRMREALDPNNATGIALPPERILMSELCAFTWEPVVVKGKTTIKVCSRDDIVERIGHSPDYATAYVLANIDTPRNQLFSSIRKGSRPRSLDYDPYQRMN
jgi:hypothetical protein